jgi:hypothetical protein
MQFLGMAVVTYDRHAREFGVAWLWVPTVSDVGTVRHVNLGRTP